MFCSFTRASGMPGKPGFSDPFFLSFTRVLTKLPVTLPRVPRYMSDRWAWSTQRSGQPLGMPWLAFPTIVDCSWVHFISFAIYPLDNYSATPIRNPLAIYIYMSIFEIYLQVSKTSLGSKYFWGSKYRVEKIFEKNWGSKYSSATIHFTTCWQWWSI